MKQRFTRGRWVEYCARDRLRSDGFHVVRPSGSCSPVDLIAWRPEEQVLLVQVKRVRSPAGNVSHVARVYHCDLQALREVKRPHLARKQFWLWNGSLGWRFFLVMPGGICEVADYVA